MIIIVLSLFITSTFCWQNFNQRALNEAGGEGNPGAEVELTDYERLPDGTPTENPLKDSVFHLFTKDGEQIGGNYVTDENGKILVTLPRGDYYFEQIIPTQGYDFDKDGDKIKKKYEFSILDSEKVTVTVYNPRKLGKLYIEKTVENTDKTPVTPQQKDMNFEFTVTFSDNGTYKYVVVDKESGAVLAPEKSLTSGGTIKLKHGQRAVFSDIPVGVIYEVTEIPVENYVISTLSHRGTIKEQTSTAQFFNFYTPNPVDGKSKIRVKKIIKGDYPEEDLNKEFKFTLKINGEIFSEFTLKPEQTKEFEVPSGSEYEVIEDDYTKDQYNQDIRDGHGITKADEIAPVVAINTYVGKVDTIIKGEKFWNLKDAGQEVLPESITVRLKVGDSVIEEKKVKPDKNGKWNYSFTAPKYDAEGKEIQYTVEEAELPEFVPSYEGTNITNTYIEPIKVTLPKIQKIVKGEDAPKTEFNFMLTGKNGAPMPDKVKGESAFVTIDGPGIGEFEAIEFTRPGEYSYTLRELKENKEGWIYDTGIYHIEVKVTLKGEVLNAEIKLLKNEENTEKAVFVNEYAKILPGEDKVEIKGNKTWLHGNNPVDKRPEFITVYLYADGVLKEQRMVTAKDQWKYSFIVPKHTDDGKLIKYTIGEKEIEGYETVVNGYDLSNIYKQKPDAGGGSGSGTGSDAETGDRNKFAFWAVALLISIGALIAIYRKKK